MEEAVLEAEWREGLGLKKDRRGFEIETGDFGGQCAG